MSCLIWIWDTVLLTCNLHSLMSLTTLLICYYNFVILENHFYSWFLGIKICIFSTWLPWVTMATITTPSHQLMVVFFVLPLFTIDNTSPSWSLQHPWLDLTEWSPTPLAGIIPKEQCDTQSYIQVTNTTRTMWLLSCIYCSRHINKTDRL